MNTYCLIATDGQTYGPVDENTLIQWVRERRIDESSQIRCVETGEVTSAGLLPVLASVLNQSSQLSLPQAAEPLPVNNLQLTTFPVAAVILLHYLTCGIFSLIWLNLMHGKFPKVRSDDPSAGKAVGFCFIPFFNLYWIFFTYRRLCLRIDEQRELYGLPPSKLRGMATTACVFQVIPYLNVLLGYTIIFPIFIGQTQASINQLVIRSASTAPVATLPAQPATSKGMSGWIVALIVCGCLIPFIAIMAALLLPALAAAKNKASVINSDNNLKQIGLAFRLWEGDHHDQFPFNVSQADGGVKELCGTDSNGFEKNSVAVFMVMSNELSTPIILVSPNDSQKTPARDFQSLRANNITYMLRSGTNVNDSHPDEILAVDPINGIVLLCDGSVQRDPRYKSRH